MSAAAPNPARFGELSTAVVKALKRHAFEDVTLRDLMEEPGLRKYNETQVKNTVRRLVTKAGLPILIIVPGNLWRYTPGAPLTTSGSVAPEKQVDALREHLTHVPPTPTTRYVQAKLDETPIPAGDRHVTLATMGAVIKLVHSIRPGELVLLYREEDGRLYADRDPEA